MAKDNGNKFGNDRGKYSMLVVCKNVNLGTQLHDVLKALGFTDVSSSYTHVIFDAKDSDIPAEDFLKKYLERENETIMIALSSQSKSSKT